MSTLENVSDDVNNQYALLNILDGKASALLSYNSIFLAVIAFMLDEIEGPAAYGLLIVFLNLIVKCIFLQGVIWLRWSNLEESAEELNYIRKSRTYKYQAAWALSLVTVLFFLVFIALYWMSR